MPLAPPRHVADTGPGGTYARLAELGHAPARFREDLRSRMPQPDEADRLDIKPGTPVIDILRLAVATDGTRGSEAYQGSRSRRVSSSTIFKPASRRRFLVP